jgi:hypothetical protein
MPILVKTPFVIARFLSLEGSLKLKLTIEIHHIGTILLGMGSNPVALDKVPQMVV